MEPVSDAREDLKLALSRLRLADAKIKLAGKFLRIFTKSNEFY
jgi:hypothetical protein